MADPFDVLHVPARFDLDMNQVEATHRELSKTLHPDRYVGAPANERRLALSRAIEVNEALRVLRDPVRRAEALLARAGVKLEEGREPAASPDFLMEVLELRETLAGAQRAKDLTKVRRLAEDVRTQESAVLAKLGAAFSALNAADTASVERAQRLIGELRFARRFLEEAGAIEDELC